MAHGMNTFADLHCANDDDHDHEHEHDERWQGFIFIGAMSVLTVMLSAWSLYKLAIHATKLAKKKDRMNSRSFAVLTTFFSLCIICSSMRVPVLWALCNRPGNGTLYMYAIYATTYKLQWALLVAVLFSRLQCFAGIGSTLVLGGLKCERVLVALALFISAVAWTTNCLRLLTHNEALDDMNWFLGAVSIGSLIICCKLLSISFIRMLRKCSFATFGCDVSSDAANMEFVELATKLAILSSVSALSSAIMCVCVVLVGLLSHGMTDSLLFWWFSGETIDVAGNCLAVFLAIQIGSAQYAFVCGPMHLCCQGMCAAMAKRTHRRKQKLGAKKTRKTATTKVELAIAECIAADAVDGQMESNVDSQPTPKPEQGTPVMSCTDKVNAHLRHIHMNGIGCCGAPGSATTKQVIEEVVEYPDPCIPTSG